MSEAPRRRPAAFGSTAAASQPPGSAETSVGDTVVDAQALTARYNALRQRRDQINARRMRIEVELSSAQRAEAQCADEARKLGVGSVEELEALIRRQAQEDAQALDQLEEKLNQQEALINSIDERVTAAETR